MTYTGGNTTGFASPAGDSIEGPLDLADILDMRRPSRYPVRVAGDALIPRGILHGDILIADAATPPSSGRIAIVMLAGDVLVAQLAHRDGQWWLQSGIPHAQAVPIGEDTEIWAIVTGLVRTSV